MREHSLLFPWPKGMPPSMDIVARMLTTVMGAWLGGFRVSVREVENADSYAITVDWSAPDA